jgi:hypothetical protein
MKSTVRAPGFAIYPGLDNSTVAWISWKLSGETAYGPFIAGPKTRMMTFLQELEVNYADLYSVHRSEENCLEKDQIVATLNGYMTKINAFYEACDEYPSQIALPPPTNRLERYALIWVRGFLEEKTGKKPTLIFG